MVGFCRVFSVDFRKILLRFQFKKDIIVLSNLCFMDVGCWMYFGLELVQRNEFGTKENVAAQAFAGHFLRLGLPESVNCKVGRLVGCMALHHGTTSPTIDSNTRLTINFVFLALNPWNLEAFCHFLKWTYILTVVLQSSRQYSCLLSWSS